jgi:hypothetical protein
MKLKFRGLDANPKPVTVTSLEPTIKARKKPPFREKRMPIVAGSLDITLLAGIS